MTASLFPDAGDAYYCGCWGDLGHMVWTPGRGRAKVASKTWAQLDGGFTPTTLAQGHAKLTHLNGWTFLGFPDYSVDDRAKSHSTFALRGIHDFAAAVALARERFPEVFARFTFEIKEVEAEVAAF